MNANQAAGAAPNATLLTETMTRKELLEKIPDMKFDDNSFALGEQIPAEDGVIKLLAYREFIKKMSMPGQALSVGFNSANLIAWLQANSSRIDEVKVFLAIEPINEEKEMLSVVFWPYLNGLPATEDEKDGGTVLSPFNIGGRQPITMKESK